MEQQGQHCIIIGAMKCGTTSLFHSLSKHPRIAASRTKDTKFFIDGKNGGNWERGPDWYADMFPRTGGIRLEASTHYAKYPDFPGVPRRIRQTLPEVKLIYLVRDPLRRAISHFFHNILVDGETLDIEQAFSSEATKYLHYSDYGMQLSQYRDHFSPEEIAVLNITEPDHRAESLAILARFLEIQDPGTSLVLERKNALRDNLEKTPWNAAIRKAILDGSSDNIEWALRLGLSRATLTRLIRRCGEYAEKFQAFYPFSVEGWLEDYKNYL
uniref:Sulfotransferase domain-containing protein n=1 Tax=Candidatus Kentrum sp. FW TaxID=2126338 RepID=A0A450RZ11_9GAMM|nr:MAG: Sulfotransferase domain-containing protein [Candidatus Kentron sp. FW]